MSKTLFKYIFWDLFRIFGLTSGVLAGIMSFGGLLRPLTQHGLDAAQVGKMLAYFMPAMSTYSLPIAALFATTIVYGRLSADNELTAMRAAGIGYLFISLPAIILGLLVASISLGFLFFIVPSATLKVEQVIYSNLAKVVAFRIERTHEISLGSATVFAQGAFLPEPDAAHPEEQRVVLIGPAIKTYKRVVGEDGKRLKIPDDFWIAKQATVYIRQDAGENDDVTLEVSLEEGIKFPRELKGGVEAGIGATQFGPIPLPSPIKENTKFMDYWRLHELYFNRDKSQRIRDMVRAYIKKEQELNFRQVIHDALNDAGEFTFNAGGETYLLRRRSTNVGRAEYRRNTVLIPGELPSADADKIPGALVVRDVELIQLNNGTPALSAQARQVQVRVNAEGATNRFNVTLRLYDALVHAGQSADSSDTTARDPFTRSFSVPMSDKIRAIRKKNAEYFTSAKTISTDDRRKLARELVIIANDVRSEMQSRASFAISCFILVMVGCALGMMFKSGNFLSAFAVSVIPAMISILLIVTGQHTCQNVPETPTPGNNPLVLGLSLIWSGNVIVALMGFTLWWRLRRR